MRDMEKPSSICFAVDHGKMLADCILFINRSRLEQLERVAKDDGVERGHTSIAMQNVEREWAEQISQTCHEMLAHISQMVAGYQRLAADAINAAPTRLIPWNTDCNP